MGSCNNAPLGADYCQRLMECINRGDGFASACRISITRVEPGLAEGELTVGPDSLNPRGMVHGGALASLADTVGGVAAHSTGRSCVTLNCTMNYLRPAHGSRIRCCAKLQKTGRTVQVCDVALTDDEGKTVATGTYTFFASGDLDPDEYLPKK